MRQIGPMRWGVLVLAGLLNDRLLREIRALEASIYAQRKGTALEYGKR